MTKTVQILTRGEVLIKNLVDYFFYLTHNSNKCVFWIPRPEQMGSNNSEREKSQSWYMAIIKSNGTAQL